MARMNKELRGGRLDAGHGSENGITIFPILRKTMTRRDELQRGEEKVLEGRSLAGETIVQVAALITKVSTA